MQYTARNNQVSKIERAVKEKKKYQVNLGRIGELPNEKSMEFVNQKIYYLLQKNLKPSVVSIVREP